MRILFFGDSITDMGRERDTDERAFKLGLGVGTGYVNLVTAELSYTEPNRYEFINRGIAGNRSVDLYARIKADCWNYQPDVVSILVGINDIYPVAFEGNGVELDRSEKVYRMMIEDTKSKLPSVKLMLCEPFMLVDSAMEGDRIKWESPLGVRAYAKMVKRLAEEYGATFIPLQDKLSEAAAKVGAEYYLFDGIHPTPAGAKLIANEWLKAFKAEIEK